jgi:hypothetical protein
MCARSNTKTRYNPGASKPQSTDVAYGCHREKRIYGPEANLFFEPILSPPCELPCDGLNP